MSEHENILDAIEAEPSSLGEHAVDLQDILDTGDVEARQDVAETLRDSARDSPAVVARHTELLETALHDDDPEVRRFGAVATANVCHTTPETVTGLVEELVDAYETFKHGSEQITVIRALGIIGGETATTLDQYDPWFAELLRTGEGIVPAETAENLGNLVVESPHEYPETIRALVTVLGEGGHELRSHAMMTVALIASEDVTVFSAPDQVLAAVTELRSHRNIDTEKVDKAIKMIRTAVNEHEATE